MDSVLWLYEGSLYYPQLNSFKSLMFQRNLGIMFQRNLGITVLNQVIRLQGLILSKGAAWKAAASHSSLTRTPVRGRVSRWAMFCGLYFGHHDIKIILTTPKYSQKSCAVSKETASFGFLSDLWLASWKLFATNCH